MDADLQDPPELIEQMIDLWRQGNRIVYATRRQRAGEGAFKRFTSWTFYRLLNAFSEVDIPMDTGDFRLVDRRVLEALRACRETDRFRARLGSHGRDSRARPCCTTALPATAARRNIVR